MYIFRNGFALTVCVNQVTSGIPLAGQGYIDLNDRYLGKRLPSRVSKKIAQIVWGVYVLAVIGLCSNNISNRWFIWSVFSMSKAMAR